MKKKKASKWKWALWGLVCVSLLCIVFTPLNRRVSKLQWRVPVNISMPKLSVLSQKLPDLPDLPKTLPDMPVMPKIGIPDIEKVETALHDKVDDIFPDLPFPYEAEPRREAPPVFEAPLPPRPPEHGKGARIALIIDDMGLVPSLSARAVKLPGKVTLAYLPYAQNLSSQTEGAAAAGHDIMLHLPMEPLGGENPGPFALKLGQSEAEWKSLLEKALSSFDGYIGVNNHMGSKLTADGHAMAFVMQVLKEKGVFFVDSRTNGKSVAEKAAHDSGVRSTGRDVFLDDTQTQTAVKAQLAEVERIARKKGQAVAIGHPHAVTLIELERWLPEVQARGYELVPVRSLVR